MDISEISLSAASLVRVKELECQWIYKCHYQKLKLLICLLTYYILSLWVLLY